MKLLRNASNSHDLKVLNRLSVLEIIRKQGPVARYEVAKLTKLTPPTVTVIVNELLKAGIINEVGEGKSSGGRKPVMLELNSHYGYIFAVRIQRGEIVSALIDLAGTILENRRLKLETAVPEDVVSAVKSCFEQLLKISEIPKQRVFWCGVASPGLVDPYRGVVERSANLNWGKVPFGKMLAEALQLPVHIENISNAAALGEKVFGGGRGLSDLIYLNLSVGIGAGIIINNEVYGGARGYAGEVGHMVLSPSGGPKCTCGRQGCFEAFCGVHAILERIKTKVPDEIFNQLNISKARICIDDVMNPRFFKSHEVQEVFQDAAGLIGIMVANLVSLFDIETIILGGELARAGDYLLKTVSRVVMERTLAEIGKTVQIFSSAMSEDPPLMGVYALVIDKLFHDEEWFELSLCSFKQES